MTTDTGNTVLTADPRLRHVPVLAIALTALADFLFYREPVGWTAGIYGLALLLMLYACAWTGTDRPVAWFNVLHCAEVRGEGHSKLDIRHVRSLGMDALPALIWLEREHRDAFAAPHWREVMGDMAVSLDNRMKNWRAWTLQRAETRADCRGWMDEPVDILLFRFPYGTLLARIPHAILVAENEPETASSTQHVYRAGTAMELVNADRWEDLHPGDQVEMNFELLGERRNLRTLVRDLPSEMEYCGEEPEEEPEPVIAPPPPAPPETLIATGHVAALRPGRLIVREKGPVNGTFTNQAYAVATEATLHGLSSLAELQADQRITFRYSTPAGKPTILELATRGASLTDPAEQDGTAP